jgi:hypothetical protein
MTLMIMLAQHVGSRLKGSGGMSSLIKRADNQRRAEFPHGLESIFQTNERLRKLVCRKAYAVFLSKNWWD